MERWQPGCQIENPAGVQEVTTNAQQEGGVIREGRFHTLREIPSYGTNLKAEWD